MTALDLLARCRSAGVRLFLRDDGQALRYDAPGGIDPALKAELRTHKAELVRLLAGDWLTEMHRDPDSKALVHHEWHALPAGVREALDAD